MLSRVANKLGWKRRLRKPHATLGTPVSRFINQFKPGNAHSRTYLEIGVEHGFTFEAVIASTKVAVDPNIRFSTWPKYSGIELNSSPSDYYFAESHSQRIFDVIFIDGLHTAEQTWKDFCNSLVRVKDGGIIILDDTVPSDSFSAIPSEVEAYKQREQANVPNDFSWHGDVFRLIPHIAEIFPNLRYATVIDTPNPFTVFWNFAQSKENFLTHKSLPNLSFKEFFSEGMPDIYNSSSASQILGKINAE
jgi:hypothetical protein